jgi:hypothetical protein
VPDGKARSQKPEARRNGEGRRRKPEARRKVRSETLEPGGHGELSIVFDFSSGF